jgi:hypothetical protein
MRKEWPKKRGLMQSANRFRGEKRLGAGDQAGMSIAARRDIFLFGSSAAGTKEAIEKCTAHAGDSMTPLFIGDYNVAPCTLPRTRK